MKVTVSVDAVETGANPAVDDNWAVKVTDVSTEADEGGGGKKANVAGAEVTVWVTGVAGAVRKLVSAAAGLKVARME